MAGCETTLIFLFWDCQAQWLTLEVCIVRLCLLWLEFTLLYKTHADYLKNKSCTLIRIFCSCQSRNLAQLLGYFTLLNLYLLFLSRDSSLSMPTGFPELCFLRSLSSVTILQTAFLPPASFQNEYSTGLIFFFHWQLTRLLPRYVIFNGLLRDTLYILFYWKLLCVKE